MILINNKSKNTNDTNDAVDQPRYLCFASGKNGYYFVAVGSENVSSDNSLNSELFKNYVGLILKKLKRMDRIY